jgi:hypothetical protein
MARFGLRGHDGQWPGARLPPGKGNAKDGSPTLQMQPPPPPPTTVQYNDEMVTILIEIRNKLREAMPWAKLEPHLETARFSLTLCF